LDVGCNIGHVTLLIGRDFGAEKVDGIDIDSRLIDIARKNVKHYVNSEFKDPDNPNIAFPKCMPKMYGPLHEPRGLPNDTRKIPFPYNVRFRQVH
jgi:7SK snRNA methylphosphate capping enzyme